MKTVLIWPRSTDWKILAVLGAAVIGFAIPAPLDVLPVRMAVGALSIALLVFTWAAFQIVRPLWSPRIWLIAEVVLVPMIWTSLLLGLVIWFGYMRHESAKSNLLSWEPPRIILGN